jgi:hypothetical protein
MHNVYSVVFILIVIRTDIERSWDSLVGIATRYWLDGPGIESRWGRGFSVPAQTGCEAHPASYAMGTVLSRG